MNNLAPEDCAEFGSKTSFRKRTETVLKQEQKRSHSNVHIIDYVHSTTSYTKQYLHTTNFHTLSHLHAHQHHHKPICLHTPTEEEHGMDTSAISKFKTEYDRHRTDIFRTNKLTSQFTI